MAQGIIQKIRKLEKQHKSTVKKLEKLEMELNVANARDTNQLLKR